MNGEKGCVRMEIYMTEDATLDVLSLHFKMPIELIRKANPSLKSDEIEKGEMVHIPGWYKQMEADSALDLTLDYPDELKYANRITKPIIDSKKEYDFFQLERDLAQLQSHYPFIRKREIGRSVLDFPIYELLIGSGDKMVHMNGSFHANEWITSAVMMKWLEDYVKRVVKGETYEGREARDLFEQLTISFVPMVNPDGVNLVLKPSSIPEEALQQAVEINEGKSDFSQWKANIRGVDLNNQYPAYWEIEKERKIPKAPAPRDFPGNAPLTEPEARAMALLVEESNFDCVVAFHTQGEEIYWGYLNYEPKRAAKIVNEFKRVSGYKPVRNIDSHAGFRDWFVYKYRKPGFTVELGNGVNPLPLSQFDEIYEKSKGIFWSILYM